MLVIQYLPRLAYTCSCHPILLVLTPRGWMCGPPYGTCRAHVPFACVHTAHVHNAPVHKAHVHTAHVRGATPHWRSPNWGCGGRSPPPTEDQRALARMRQCRVQRGRNTPMANPYLGCVGGVPPPDWIVACPRGWCFRGRLRCVFPHLDPTQKNLARMHQWAVQRGVAPWSDTPCAIGLANYWVCWRRITAKAFAKHIVVNQDRKLGDRWQPRLEA